MLREITCVRQIPGEAQRRWFTDDDMDLYIWLNPSKTIIGFQLCYNKLVNEQALTWKTETGFELSQVETTDNPLDQKTPILTQTQDINGNDILTSFNDRTKNIDCDIRNFVKNKLDVYSKIVGNAPKKEHGNTKDVLMKLWHWMVQWLK